MHSTMDDVSSSLDPTMCFLNDMSSLNPLLPPSQLSSLSPSHFLSLFQGADVGVVDSDGKTCLRVCNPRVYESQLVFA